MTTEHALISWPAKSSATASPWTRTASVKGAASAILGIAESEDADLIVVGNRGMTGARRVLGSVPNSVAHGARCAVLIVPTE